MEVVANQKIYRMKQSWSLWQRQVYRSNQFSFVCALSSWLMLPLLNSVAKCNCLSGLIHDLGRVGVRGARGGQQRAAKYPKKQSYGWYNAIIFSIRFNSWLITTVPWLFVVLFWFLCFVCLWVSFLSLLVSLLLYTVTALLYRSTQAPFLNAHCRHDDVATALIRGNLQNVTGCPDKRPDESHLALDGSQLQVGSSSSPYALRLPHKKQNHLQNSLLRRIGYGKPSQNRLRSKRDP